ncbi:MAG: hypothetical protein AAGM22_07925 [Acidobacteriota bacterium]
MIEKAVELRGVLNAYKALVDIAWEDLHPGMAGGVDRWRFAGAEALAQELDGYLTSAAAPPREIRIFWKLGNELRFAGCNLPFAHDAGFTAPSQLVGNTDFCESIPWTRQAAKYQADDREVMASGKPRPFILERQTREDQVVWLFTSKASIMVGGEAVGLFGLYETIDAARAMEIRRRMESEFP